MHRLRILQSRWRIGGLFGVGQLVTQRFLARCWQSQVFSAGSLAEGSQIQWPDGYRYVWYSYVGEIRPLDVDRLRRHGASPLLNELDAHDALYVVWHGDEPAAWGAAMPHSPQLSVLGLPRGAWLIGMCETRPAHRGRGLFPAGLLQTVETLRSLGHDELFVEAADWNVVSQRSIAKAGFRHEKRVDAVVLFGTLVWRDGGLHRVNRSAR
jgi:hypothetical protein